MRFPEEKSKFNLSMIQGKIYFLIVQCCTWRLWPEVGIRDPDPEIIRYQSRIPNFSSSIPHPDPKSRDFQSPSRIPKSVISIPNPEIWDFKPKSRSRIPKFENSIPNPDPEIRDRDRDFVGIVGISIPNADLWLWLITYEAQFFFWNRANRAYGSRDLALEPPSDPIVQFFA